MSIELFTGKAEFYANARPGYPKAALDYINSLAPTGAVFADIGAGTGKFTEQLARFGNEIHAVEPNDDMRKMLYSAVSSFPNVKIFDGTAENTTLPGNSADIITCAQALHWFDTDKFREECRRIGKPGVTCVVIYNLSPGGNSVEHCKQSTEKFFINPIVEEFINTISYTRENWLQYMTSHSHDPLPSDAGYDAHIAKANEVFNRESSGGLLCRDIVTKVLYEKIL